MRQNLGIPLLHVEDPLDMSVTIAARMNMTNFATYIDQNSAEWAVEIWQNGVSAP